MNAIMSRRSLLGATAAIGAVALPVAAVEALAAPTASADPDANLLALIARHAELLAAWQEAGAASDAAAARAQDAYPPLPQALFQRSADYNHDLGRAAGRLHRAEGLPRFWYNLDDIDRLRAAGPILQAGYTGEGDPDEPVPDLKGEARRAEILAAADAYAAARGEVDRRVGVVAADRATDAALVALDALEGRLNALVPQTLPGIVAKARWAVASDCDDLPETVLRQIASLEVAA